MSAYVGIIKYFRTRDPHDHWPFSQLIRGRAWA